MVSAIVDRQVSLDLLREALEAKGIWKLFQERYRLANDSFLAYNFNGFGWYVWDDGHMTYRTRYKGLSNFDGESVEFLNAISENFELIAERQENNELISYFRRKAC